MKKYFNYRIDKVITVKNLITIEYLDVSPSFLYPEETHNFYELAYIDNGEICCHTDGKELTLSQGELILIPPEAKHFYSVTEVSSASIFIVCFSSNSEILTVFENKLSLDKTARMLIADILNESKKAFSFPFMGRLEPLSSPIFGAQQLVENNIEKLLIYLVRGVIEQNEDIKFVMNSFEFENNLVNDIISLLKANLYSRLTLDSISHHTFYSKTFLNNIFKKNTGSSIMKYYTQLKIRRAKELLRKNASPSSVSAQLKFESPTYFTKVFKKHTGMTPTAYQKTIL